jgi:hypothetical protein
MPGERALTASRLSGARMTDPRAPAHRPRRGTAAQIDGYLDDSLRSTVT